MKILVTGGAGFIGSHVCDRLLSLGHDVVCVDDFNDYYDPDFKERNIKQALKNSKYTLYRADITDLSTLKDIFAREKPEKIIHLAARAGVRYSISHPELYVRVNVLGTLNLLELAKEYKIKSFVFGSSSSVYGANKKVPFSEEDRVDDPISPYAATKKAAEELCHAYHHLYGLKITCLRFFTVYGPRGRPDMVIYLFSKAITDGKPIKRFGNGKTKRDYTFISDIVDGIIAALDKELDFEIVNLGDSNTVELNYLISLIENALGKKAKIEQSPLQPGDVPITYADISKAKKLLKYEPKVKIEQGIPLFVEWFNKR
jgi:UDP-glucuronate 4-epimerase